MRSFNRSKDSLAFINFHKLMYYLDKIGWSGHHDIDPTDLTYEGMICMFGSVGDDNSSLALSLFNRHYKCLILIIGRLCTASRFGSHKDSQFNSLTAG
nr:hypothetical protein HmN_000431700 [Hymenolepis microstoma]